MNFGGALVTPLTRHPHQVGFCALVLYRMNALVGWIRQQPVSGGNITDEALSLAFACAGNGALDIQRVYELVGIETGSSGMMCWHDGELRILGRTIDLVLRSISRPDQAQFCAARCADMMIALHELDFADPRAAVEAERNHLGRLAQAVAAQPGPVGMNVLGLVPEYPRGAIAAHARANLGKEWSEAFGPGAGSFRGPVWSDPYTGDQLKDGRDPKTTRTGNVEGW